MEEHMQEVLNDLQHFRFFLYMSLTKTTEIYIWYCKEKDLQNKNKQKKSFALIFSELLCLQAYLCACTAMLLTRLSMGFFGSRIALVLFQNCPHLSHYSAFYVKKKTFTLQYQKFTIIFIILLRKKIPIFHQRGLIRPVVLLNT